MQNDRRRPLGNNDNHAKANQSLSDLALLFTTDLYVGSLPLYKQKTKNTSLDLVYEIDGVVHRRSYLSALSWRAIMLFAFNDGKTVTVHEVDKPGRYRKLFPQTLLRRLRWHARANSDFTPVARLFDPKGTSVLLLTRSRFCSHAVDVLHNLADCGPVFQSLWIADIMALRPMLGIDLVRDEKFSTSIPISSYIRAAAKTGRIVDEKELLELDLSLALPSLPLLGPTAAISRIFDRQCIDHPQLQQLRGRTLYEDYSFSHRL